VSSSKCAISGQWIKLAASLFLIFLQACQPILQTINSPTQGVTSLPPTSTATEPRASFATIPTSITRSEPTSTTELISTSTPELTVTASPPLVFAAIGDYGSGEQAEADVANLILSWQPEFIITLGDNNYPIGAADHIDAAIGQFFHQYIYPYHGNYDGGADINRFFPTLGNHDMLTDSGQPYFDYFKLLGNERYYDFVRGPVHLFALDDLDSEPDGVGSSSAQGMWLQGRLAASISPWNIVYMHYPPYSSGTHGSTDWARWPYGKWGVDAVLAGHDHTYERLLVDGVTYFVNGTGGYSLYDFVDILEGSQVRYNDDYGAMRIEATNGYLLFEFFNRDNKLIDQVELRK
jgi:tartrate-resistant acid phosphatase type 5